MFYYLSFLIFGLSPFLFSLLLSSLRSLSQACRLGSLNSRPSTLAILCFLPLALSLGPGALVYSAQVALQWDANTDPTVTGYKVYYGTSTGNYPTHVDVGKTTTYTVSNLQDGATYYFATTDYNASGTESGFSNEVVFGGTPCTYSMSPSTQSFSSSAGTGSVSVTTGVGCSWTAVRNADWIAITSNNSVTGSGKINYSVASNSSSSSRSGTMTIAGQTFTATQTGASLVTLSITNSGTGTGTVSNSPVGGTFNAGTVVTLTATPDAGSSFAGWSGGCKGTSSTCSVTMTGNTSVTAVFIPKTLTINATAGANGSISPQGSATVNYGTSQSFAITPATGYRVNNVQVDGVSVGAVTSYLFGNVMVNHTISASFKALSRSHKRYFSAEQRAKR